MSGNFALDWMKPLASRLRFPAIVNINIGPAVIDQPAADHGIGGGTNFAVIDRVGETIPTVPTQRRGQGDLVSDNDFQPFFITAPRVFGAQAHGIFARPRHHARDVASGGVQFQPAGKVFTLTLTGASPVTGT